MTFNHTMPQNRKAINMKITILKVLHVLLCLGHSAFQLPQHLEKQ